MENVGVIGLQDLFVEHFHIQTVFGGAHGNVQGLVNRFGVDLLPIHVEVGASAFQTVAGLRQGAAVFAAQFIHLFLNVILIQIQVGNDGNGVDGGKALVLCGLPLSTAAGAAVIVGGFHNGIDIQLGTGIGRGELDHSVVDLNGHIQLGEGVDSSLVKHLLGRFRGLAAQIHTCGIHIVEDQTVVLRLGEQDIHRACGGEDHHRKDAAQCHDEAGIAFFLSGRPFGIGGRCPRLRLAAGAALRLLVAI